MYDKDTQGLKEILDKAKKIKVLVLDVDGVLTDGRIIYGNYGDEIKNFNVNDGLGMYLIMKSGVKCVILTAKSSKVVTRRARELKINKLYSGYHFKIEAYKKILKKFKVADEEICFMGDDVIDIPVLKRAGLAVSPPNAMKEASDLAHFMTKNKGGHGAVRELCDFIMKAQGTWEKATYRYFND